MLHYACLGNSCMLQYGKLSKPWNSVGYQCSLLQAMVQLQIDASTNFVESKTTHTRHVTHMLAEISTFVIPHIYQRLEFF